MGKQENKMDKNQLEKQMNEISKGQNNANNPENHVGADKVPTPTKNLFKSPIFKITAGTLVLIPLVFNLIANFSMGAALFDPAAIIVCVGFIIGGILRLRKKE